MAEHIQMPKLGNSVESCIIVEWMVKPGDTVKTGDVLCVAETDKAAVDVEAKQEGVVLALLAEEGDEVPVYAPIAVLGEEGENFDPGSAAAFGGKTEAAFEAAEKDEVASVTKSAVPDMAAEPIEMRAPEGEVHGVSPRAKNLASKKYVDPLSLSGTGPGGRVIERDVAKAAALRVPISPAAADMAAKKGMSIPDSGSGIGGRVLASDLTEQGQPSGDIPAAALTPGEITEIPVKGMRRIIADTMLTSLATTAQFTAHSSADATKLLELRKRFKESGSSMGLEGVTLNDLAIFAVVKTIKSFPNMNAHFSGGTVKQFPFVHMGIAVDTDRGLMVPVLRNADRLSLKGISDEAKKIYASINSNSISPDDLSGSTFTVTNLGSLGVQRFTPVLNIPEVAILGICSIEQKPVLINGDIVHRPHIGFSLTVNHQIIDGAPAARFLKVLGENIKNIDLLLSV